MAVRNWKGDQGVDLILKNVTTVPEKRETDYMCILIVLRYSSLI